MIDFPKVSILIPVYNVEKYIPRCLDSIFHQSYAEIEYVFVDDCTPDNSMLLIDRYIEVNGISRDKVKIISHSYNQGIAVTRNDCIANASGDYVLFVDSDDWIEPDMVEQLVIASNNGKADIVGCDFYEDFGDGRLVPHFEPYSSDCKENIVLCLNYRIATALWKMLIRRNIFSYFQFQPEIEIGEDYVASVKLYYYASSCACVHKCLYHYVKYNNDCYSKMIEKSIHDHILAVNAVEKFLKQVHLYNSAAKKELNLRKFCIKKYYLSKQMFDINKWNTTFPDVTDVWRNIGYPVKEKCIYWLAEKKLFLIIMLLRFLRV